MRILKLYLAAIAITLVEFIINFLSNSYMFRFIFRISPTSVWKPLNGAPSAEYYVGGLLLNIVFVMAFTILYSAVPKDGWKKGVVYGFLVWLVGVLPVMFGAYLFVNMAKDAVLYLTILGLFNSTAKGAVAALLINK